MSKKPLLIAILAGLSLLESTGSVAQNPPDLAPALTLNGVRKQFPLSEVLPVGYLDGVKLSDITIDYLKIETPHASYSTLAANVTSTLGGLCHFGKVKNTELEIVQSCPAPVDTKKRLDAWRDFFNGKRRVMPPGAKVYVIRNGRDIFPVVEAELKMRPALLSQALAKKSPISIQLSPPCKLPTSANGERITQLCSRSIPVQFPDFAARVDGSNLNLNRLSHGESSAYLAFTAPGKPQVRVQVNVEPLSCSFGDRTFPVGSMVTAFPNSIVPAGGVCTGIQLACEPEKIPVLLSVRWYRKDRSGSQAEVEPSGLFLTCQVDVPRCPGGQEVAFDRVDEDGDGFFKPTPPEKVCLPKGDTWKGYREIGGRRYGRDVGSFKVPLEDAACDKDRDGQKWLTITEYFADYNYDGKPAKYGVFQGCVRQATDPGFLGFLMRPGKRPVAFSNKAPVGGIQSSDADTAPSSSSSSSLTLPGSSSLPSNPAAGSFNVSPDESEGSSSSEETLGRPKLIIVDACGDEVVGQSEECEQDTHCIGHETVSVGRSLDLRCVNCRCEEGKCGNGMLDEGEECDTPKHECPNDEIGKHKECIECRCLSTT
jgi:hypothetical protein